MTGRSPDLYLKAMNKATGQKSGRLGVAWTNDDGSLSLALDMCVTLTSDPDVVYTLFPNDQRYEAEPKARKKKNPTMADLPVSVAHKPFGPNV